MKPLYEFKPEKRDELIEFHLNRGKIVGRAEGSFGDVFFLEGAGQQLVAKCPRISKFGNPTDARKAIEKALYEIENTARFMKSPGAHRFAPPKLILGWPFFLSQRRDGTLSDLIIKAPDQWPTLERLAVLIHVAHVLNSCRSLGLSAHQDLKPENILFSCIPLPEGGKAQDLVGYRTFAYVSDFGIADAFRHIGQNTGSRPYMAPEQFTDTMIVDGSKIDVFALGVIAFECFTGGLHPIGERTTNVWPKRAAGKPATWNKPGPWKQWAKSEKDLTPLSGSAIPVQLTELIRDCLAADPSLRPDMDTLESRLWLSLIELNQDWANVVRMQIEANLDRYATYGEPAEWPDMEECIAQLRTFYSEMS